jgi:hypothetical protein
MRKDLLGTQDSIEEFFVLLKKVSDEPKNVHIFTNFLRTLLRSKSVNGVLPMIEILTIIKHEKPLIFSLMRRSGGSGYIYTFSNIEMDIKEAERRLSLIKAG